MTTDLPDRVIYFRGKDGKRDQTTQDDVVNGTIIATSTHTTGQLAMIVVQTKSGMVIECPLHPYEPPTRLK